MTSNTSGVCATLAATLILGGITLSAAAVCTCGTPQEITDIKWKKHGFTYYGEDGIRHKVKFK